MAEIFKFPEYEQHPIATKLMPGGMDDAEFEAFCEDVEARGVLMPLTLYQGKVLDGWHRYRAAKRYGIAFKHVTYEGNDPAGYIASVNVLRRKLGSLQRALVACKLHREHGYTQRDACKKLAISNEVLTLVLRALDSKNSVLLKRIETDTEFSRGMLREELEDAGLMRAKAPKEEAPKGPTSVFDTKGMLSGAGAARGLEDLLAGKDTDGSDEPDAEEDFEPVPDKGKKPTHPERKPKASAAQLLSDGFHALMEDEKKTFLSMIWPVAGKLCVDLGLWGAPLAKKPAQVKEPKERRAANATDNPLAAMKRGTDVKKVVAK